MGMPILVAIFLFIILLVVLTAVVRMSPFISFLLVTITAGFILGMPPGEIIRSMQKGIGDMLGSVIIVLSAGAMMGKLLAESGAARVIADKMMSIFGVKHLSWGLVLTGFIIGIPLFYNVGFVLVIPIIFSLAHQYRLSTIPLAIPVLASLSVAHSLLPPHPSPATLIGIFNADMATTFLYGIIIGIPAVILAGPLFSKAVKHIKPTETATIRHEITETKNLPGFFISLFSALFPVFLLIITYGFSFFSDDITWLKTTIDFIKEPTVLMLISLLVVMYNLGLRQGTGIKKIMSVYEDGFKEVAMIVLIIGASGGFKQILIDSHASDVIATFFQQTQMNPLLLGWTIALCIRVCLGSATVAGLTAAGIIAPLMSGLQADPNLMILAIGAGSIFFSHVNDTGFWMFKEYFNVSIKDTFLSWTLMESIASIAGIAGVLIMDIFI